MADFFAPMSDIQSDIMRPIDPLLLIEDGYQRGVYQIGLGAFDISMDREGQGLGSFDVDMLSDQGDHHLGAAPVDPMYPGDIFTPVMNIYGGGGHLGGVPEMMDVFNVARFLFEGR